MHLAQKFMCKLLKEPLCSERRKRRLLLPFFLICFLVCLLVEKVFQQRKESLWADSYIEACLFIDMSVAIGQDCETDEGE